LIEASRAFRTLALAAALALAGCQPQGPQPTEGAMHVSPAAVTVSPGQQVQFTVRSPWGTDVTWSVQPSTDGTIDRNGLFTATTRQLQSPTVCTVVATLRSDPTKVGLAVVSFSVEPPVDMVAASGGRQVAEGIEVESVVLEPVRAVTSTDSTGTTESRSGFYPSGNTSP
jgi:hypothetical protein